MGTAKFPQAMEPGGMGGLCCCLHAVACHRTRGELDPWVLEEDRNLGCGGLPTLDGFNRDILSPGGELKAGLVAPRSNALHWSARRRLCLAKKSIQTVTLSLYTICFHAFRFLQE